MKTPKIFEIKKFAVHDGDGIRTTVFLKGCSLKCVWCHNPESISEKSELAFYKHKCTSCGACTTVCGNHKIVDGVHIFDRKACIACGKCEKICENGAIKLFGREMSVDEIYNEVAKDKEFYETSGGGVTLSGGECLLYPEFCAALLKKCRESGINTAVDTCGNVAREAIDTVFPYTDMFLYDLKAFSSDVHKKCTGVENKRILENLRYINDKGGKIEIRYPYVPEYNSGEAESIAKFINSLENVVRTRVLAFHDYARSKYAAMDMPDTMPVVLPKPEDVEKAQKLFDK